MKKLIIALLMGAMTLTVTAETQTKVDLVGVSVMQKMAIKWFYPP